MAGSLAEEARAAHFQQGAPSAPERRRFGLLQKHQSRAWRGLEPLQLGLQPRAAVQLFRSGRVSAPVRHAAGAAMERSGVGLRGSANHHGAPAKGRWSGGGSGNLQALQGFEGPCQHAHVGACWGGHCRTRGRGFL